MATKKKIFMRVALLAGAGYLIYRNKDKIMGKLNKLSRMETVDEMVDDVGMTATNALEGAVSMAEEAFEYVTTFGEGGGSAEPPNVNYLRDTDEIVKGMPLNYGTQLKTLGYNLAVDINEWKNKDNTYSGVPVEAGKMPTTTFINWYNVLNMKGEGDFEKVMKLVDVSLQYGTAIDMKHDTVRDLNAKTVDYYLANPPAQYLQKNQVDWKDRSPFTDMTPQQLFTALNHKVNGTGRTVLPLSRYELLKR